MAYVDDRFPPARPWPAGVGCLGQGPIALQPFPPPPEPGELTEEEQEKLFRAGLIVIIVLGAGALLIDAILKRRNPARRLVSRKLLPGGDVMTVYGKAH